MFRIASKLDPNIWKDAVEERKEDKSTSFFICGDIAVGKTCILLKFVENGFIEKYRVIFGPDYKTKTVIYNREPLKLLWWDIYGGELDRYQYPETSLCKYTVGVMIVYDITNRDSWENIYYRWMPYVQRFAPKKWNVLIVGNKSDLASERVVSEEEARKYAKSVDAFYGEVSAKTGKNIEAAFSCLLAQHLESEPKVPEPEPKQPSKCSVM